MCGRYTLASTTEELVEAFEVPPPAFAWPPRYNVAPGQDVPVVAVDRRGRRLGLLRWGFVPAGRADARRPLVNARAESVMEKPSFREAFARRRCLIPADGFYEWKQVGRRKQPYWIHPRAGGPLAFAGIWQTWRAPNGDPRHGFVILTTEANPDVAEIHGRMPVILPQADWARWLSRTMAPEAVRDLLRPAPAGTLAIRAVTTRVNRVSEDDAALLEEDAGPS